MKRDLLANLHKLGKPLIEIGIAPAEGQDINELVRLLNDLGPDFSVIASPYNKQKGTYITLIGDATKEALQRLFGWKVERRKLPGYDNYYHWEQSGPPVKYPREIKGKIKSMWISEPGANDNGNDDFIEYHL